MISPYSERIDTVPNVPIPFTDEIGEFSCLLYSSIFLSISLSWDSINSIWLIRFLACITRASLFNPIEDLAFSFNSSGVKLDLLPCNTYSKHFLRFLML